MAQIYLNFTASTPIDPAVATAVQPFLDETFGNPSSGHWATTPAKAALENAAHRALCVPYTSGSPRLVFFHENEMRHHDRLVVCSAPRSVDVGRVTPILGSTG